MNAEFFFRKIMNYAKYLAKRNLRTDVKGLISDCETIIPSTDYNEILESLGELYRGGEMLPPNVIEKL